MRAFLAEQLAAGAANWGATPDGSWWRAAAGMLLVFGLLIVCLKLLRRLPVARGGGDARVEAIWPLGPRREIHVVRLGDAVHYVYRNEQGLVLLRQESWGDYRTARRGEPARAKEARAPSLLRALRGRLGAVRPFLIR